MQQTCSIHTDGHQTSALHTVAMIREMKGEGHDGIELFSGVRSSVCSRTSVPEIQIIYVTLDEKNLLKNKQLIWKKIECFKGKCESSSS